MVNPSMMKKILYDATEDFSPFSLVARVPHLLAVNPSLLATSDK